MELDPRFKIRAPLRCEGIGRLDCAEDLESGMRLAVRWLPLEANGSAAVQACEELPAHPTLPRIRQIGQMGASAYVAMEFPDGNLLATGLHEPLPAPVLVGITGQIADALASIHSQDTFHGEMSADSILLVGAAAEKAYLWDMPLVIANRLTDRRGEERLMFQLVKGAPYLSPERARGGKASAESDIYSLGAIICIAGGASLPVGESTLGVVHSVAVGTWVPRVPKVIPEPLRSMLERMVDREAANRPTAREVAELFLPPVVAHRTEPELRAIVLPPVAGPVLIPVPQLIPAAAPTAPAPMLSIPRAQIPSAAPTAPAPMIQPSLPAPADPLEEAAPAVALEAQRSVQLTENVSVCQELVHAGAALLSPAEAGLLRPPNRKVPLTLAAVMAVAVMVLGVLAIHLWRKPSSVLVPAPAAATLVQPMAAPIQPAAVAPAASDDDELTELTPRAKRAAPKKRAPKAELAPVAEPAPRPPEFEFLEEKPELKRPTF